MNTQQQHNLISRELDSIRTETELSLDFLPADVARLTTCIRARCFNEGFDVASALEECGLKGNSIYARFKRHFGRTPAKYLGRLRLTASRRLLHLRSIPIIDIAFGVGYSNCETFTRAFRRQYGCSPSEYRTRILVMWRDSNDRNPKLPYLDRNSLSGP